MGPVKDRYIHYEKAGDQFVRKCATGISSLKKEFTTSPVYWDLIDAPNGTVNKIDGFILDNFVTMEQITGKMFDLLQFLFASITYHYDHLDTYLHRQHKLRSSPLFIATSQGEIPGTHRTILLFSQEFLFML